MSAASGRVAAHGESGDCTRCSHSARSREAGPRAGGIGEGVEPPAPSARVAVTELHRLGVCEANDRRGVKPHPDRESLGEVLVRRLAGQRRRRVAVATPAV